MGGQAQDDTASQWWWQRWGRVLKSVLRTTVHSRLRREIREQKAKVARSQDLETGHLSGLEWGSEEKSALRDRHHEHTDVSRTVSTLESTWVKKRLCVLIGKETQARKMEVECSGKRIALRHLCWCRMMFQEGKKPGNPDLQEDCEFQTSLCFRANLSPSSAM